jgi:hypothetical protein
MEIMAVICSRKEPPIALMMEAVQTSEALVKLHQSARCYNPENSHLHIHRRENLESYFI